MTTIKSRGKKRIMHAGEVNKITQTGSIFSQRGRYQTGMA